MTILMVQQKAPDFDRWREHFDGLADQRRERGLTTLLVARDAGDAEAVVVLLEVADPERMRQHLGSAELSGAHEGAGVIPGSTRLTLLEPDGPLLGTG
ncbi:hypothetical protein [Actinotalea caeni]|uniref:hypothetical protein n=1 Tax=Actinotalea caeni TaxID=1348467 RepID=UPI0012E1802B|nr:hypothetical protein [Actinotalea caeni]